jgi:hypothetical protein
MYILKLMEIFEIFISAPFVKALKSDQNIKLLQKHIIRLIFHSASLFECNIISIGQRGRKGMCTCCMFKYILVQAVCGQK